MYTRSITILLAISGTYASPVNVKRDTCSDVCATTYNKCRSAPNTNRSKCASDYAQCLGYSPFDNSGSLVTPTACSKSAAPTSTTASNTCVADCNAAYDTCRGAPNANRATCAANYSGCLGYLPFDNSGSLVTPTACSSKSAVATPTTTSPKACADDCSTKYNACRIAPNANRATCASEYSGCLGYLPFDNSGSLVTPTACSSKSAVATPTTTSSPKACADDCSTKYNACRIAPNANRATCASEYSGCLGYLPFDNSGSLVTPTACSGTKAPAVTATSAAASSVTGIPGGCNPAHPGSCPTPATTTAGAASASTQAAIAGGWTVKNLTRYCTENGSGCEYDFGLSFADGSADKRCTIVRLPVPNALTESWFDQPCDTGSDIKVSWGYSTQFTTPFAVMTVVKQRQQAYFGVNDPNGQAVTASNPAGSGSFGDIGPQPVFSN